jgi:hypothetical protein
MGRPLIDLSGQRFGRLTVEKRAEHDKWDAPVWSCRCSCGRRCEVSRSNLCSGGTKSCGCFQSERMKHKTAKHQHNLLLAIRKANTKHGQAALRTPEYRSWQSMKTRTTNHNAMYWNYYGGRGVRCCTLFLNSFKEFLKCLGPCPNCRDRNGRRIYTLDRINPNGHYTPNNVRWATRKNQQHNLRPRRSREPVIRFVDVK